MLEILTDNGIEITDDEEADVIVVNTPFCFIHDAKSIQTSWIWPDIYFEGNCRALIVTGASHKDTKERKSDRRFRK